MLHCVHQLLQLLETTLMRAVRVTRTVKLRAVKTKTMSLKSCNEQHLSHYCKYENIDDSSFKCEFWNNSLKSVYTFETGRCRLCCATPLNLLAPNNVS